MLCSLQVRFLRAVLGRSEEEAYRAPRLKIRHRPTFSLSGNFKPNTNFIGRSSINTSSNTPSDLAPTYNPIVRRKVGQSSARLDKSHHELTGLQMKMHPRVIAVV